MSSSPTVRWVSARAGGAWSTVLTGRRPRPAGGPCGWRTPSERGSPAFDEFLRLLGDRIKLEGWARYRGGLDVKSATRSHRRGRAATPA